MVIKTSGGKMWMKSEAIFSMSIGTSELRHVAMLNARGPCAAQ
jgi:hypothetical protein